MEELLTVNSSTQPWPYPASLMIGAIALAKPDGEDIKLNDQELDQARWYVLENPAFKITFRVVILGCKIAVIIY